jgi:uncharacterized protein (DUF2141 family)
MIKFKTGFLLLVLAMGTTTLFGQHTLTIEIGGLENSKGQVLLELSDANGKMISGHNQTIENNKSVIVIKNVKPGKYSFKYFHDENNNQKLDTNMIKMPKEGFGFANNAKGKFGPPDLEKTIITITGDTLLKCTVMYL